MTSQTRKCSKMRYAKSRCPKLRHPKLRYPKLRRPKLRYPRLLSITITFLIYFALPLSAADKNKTNANSSDANKPSYELPQPARENLDLGMYQQIRYEGLVHSH